MGWSLDLTGEAVVVEFAPGRVLDGALSGEVQGKRGRAAGVIAMPEGHYPMLVTFGEIADPASVSLVDPGELATSFGPRVRLQAVTLEVTDEAVTAGVVATFPFWGPLKEQVTLSGLQFATPSKPEPLTYETYKLLKRE